MECAVGLLACHIVVADALHSLTCCQCLNARGLVDDIVSSLLGENTSLDATRSSLLGRISLLTNNLDIECARLVDSDGSTIIHLTSGLVLVGNKLIEDLGIARHILDGDSDSLCSVVASAIGIEGNDRSGFGRNHGVACTARDTGGHIVVHAVAPLHDGSHDVTRLGELEGNGLALLGHVSISSFDDIVIVNILGADCDLRASLILASLGVEDDSGLFDGCSHDGVIGLCLHLIINHVPQNLALVGVLVKNCSLDGAGGIDGEGGDVLAPATIVLTREQLHACGHIGCSDSDLSTGLNLTCCGVEGNGGGLGDVDDIGLSCAGGDDGLIVLAADQACIELTTLGHVVAFGAHPVNLGVTHKLDLHKAVLRLVVDSDSYILSSRVGASGRSEDKLGLGGSLSCLCFNFNRRDTGLS